MFLGFTGDMEHNRSGFHTMFSEDCINIFSLAFLVVGCTNQIIWPVEPEESSNFVECVQHLQIGMTF